MTIDLKAHLKTVVVIIVLGAIIYLSHHNQERAKLYFSYFVVGILIIAGYSLVHLLVKRIL